MVEAAGFRGELGGAHGYVLGRSSVPKIGQPVDGIADLHISHVRCDSRDDAGDFVGGYQRKPAAAVGVSQMCQVNSAGEMPAAWTRTSASPGWSAGMGASS